MNEFYHPSIVSYAHPASDYAERMAAKLVHENGYYKDRREKTEAERLCIAFGELANATGITLDIKPTIHPSELVPEVSGKAGEIQGSWIQDNAVTLNIICATIVLFIIIYTS